MSVKVNNIDDIAFIFSFKEIAKRAGDCKRCFLSKIFDDSDEDLCDIIINGYFAQC